MLLRCTPPTDASRETAPNWHSALPRSTFTRPILPRPTHQSQKKMKTRMKGSTGKRKLKATVREHVVPCFQPSDRGEGELKATVRQPVVPCFQPNARLDEAGKPQRASPWCLYLQPKAGREGALGSHGA
jgi:hypothetical protein